MGSNGVTAVILAGGYSSRCSRYKMTLPFRGKTIIESSIDAYLDYVDKVIVVTGHNTQLLEELFEANDRIEIIYNDHYADGMFSSVICGLSAVSGRLFIAPGDYPLLKSSTIKAMVEKFGDVIVPSMDMKAGHPIFISEKVRQEVLINGKGSLKISLSKFQREYVVVDDPGIFLDIDTDEAYEKLMGGM